MGIHGHISSQKRCVKSFCRVWAVTVLFQSHDQNISLRHSCLHPSCICPVGGCPVCTDGTNVGPRGRSVDLEQVYDHSLYLFSLCVGFFLIVIAAYAKITQIVIFSFPPIPPPSISLPSSRPISSSFITKLYFVLLLHCTASYGLLVLLLVKNLKQVSS